MLNKAGSLRHYIDAPKSSWWRDPMSLLSDALTKGKLTLSVLSPHLDISKLLREEGSPIQWGICRNSYSGSTCTLSTFI